MFCSCDDRRKRGVYCKHIAALALHELGEAAHTRSEHRQHRGLLLDM
ncbi:SWIM zinc finger family protein [Pelotomaculum isophthalicicum]